MSQISLKGALIKEIVYKIIEINTYVIDNCRCFCFYRKIFFCKGINKSFDLGNTKIYKGLLIKDIKRTCLSKAITQSCT